MRNGVIQVAVANFPPFAKFVNDTFREGPAYEFWDYVARSLNLSYNYYYVGKLDYLGRAENGSWPGIFGYLYKEVADVLLLPIYVTEERFQDFQFSAPFSFVYSVILTGPPEKHSSTMGAFVTFDFQVLAGLAISIATLILLAKLSKDGSHKVDGITSLAFQYFGSLLLKPISKDPTTLSGRLALGMWMLSLIVISNMYMSVMKAQFVNTQTLAIDNFQQLLDRDPPYKIFIFPTNYCFSSFKRTIVLRQGLKYLDYVIKCFKFSKDPVLQEVYVQSLPYQNDFEAAEDTRVYPVVKKERAAFIDAYDNILTSLDQVCSDIKGQWFHVSSTRYFFTSASLAFSKTFPPEIIEKITHRTLHFLETSLNEAVFEKSHKMAQQCLLRSASSERQQLRQIWLRDVLTIFLGWSAAMIASFIVFLLEIVVHWRFNKTATKKRPFAK